MNLLKTPDRLEAALRELEGQPRRDPIYLDPVTRGDNIAKSLAVLFLFGLFWTGSLFMDYDRSIAGVTLSVLVLLGLFVAMITINEFWMVDFEKRCLKFQRTFLGVCYTVRTVAFDEVITLAVNGRFTSKGDHKATITWWDYGISALSTDGVCHGIFPNLSRDFQTVCEVAERLARILELPLKKPFPESRLTVERKDGVPRLIYVSRLPNRFSEQDQKEQSVSPIKVSAPEAEDETAESQAPDRYEAIEVQSRIEQLIWTVFALVFTGPYALAGGAVLYLAITRPERSNILWALGFALPAVWINWLLLSRGIMNPVIKKVTYLDRSRILTVDEVRPRGQRQLQELTIPHDAKVHVLEVSADTTSKGGRPLAWRLTIGAPDGYELFRFRNPKTRGQAVREAQHIAGVLDIEVEFENLPT